MNLQQLRYLVATVDHGTMTSAAAAMHVSQPALTRAVRALEQEIGVQIFERVGRGVRLTPDGREVVALARRVLAECAAIEAVGHGASCRVVATATQANELCAPAMSHVVGERGTSPVVLLTVDTAAEVAEMVAAGRADLGVCDLPVPGELRATVLGIQETLLLCPGDWEVADPFPRRLLGTIKLVAPMPGTPRRDKFDRGLAEGRIDPAIVSETDRLEHGVPLVHAGVAATFTYRRAAERAVALGAQVVRFDPPICRPVGFVHRAGRPSAVVQRFVRALRAESSGALEPVAP